MTEQELAEKILSMIEKEEKHARTMDSLAVDNLMGLVDDIEQLCREQLEAKTHNLLVRYAEMSEVTIKTDCLDCHTLMQGTWNGEPPYTLTCSNCGQSYTVDIQENSDDTQPQRTKEGTDA